MAGGPCCPLEEGCGPCAPHGSSDTTEHNCSLQLLLAALHSTALHCTAMHCPALHCTALHYTLHHTTLPWCPALHRAAPEYTAVQCTVQRTLPPQRCDLWMLGHLHTAPLFRQQFTKRSWAGIQLVAAYWAGNHFCFQLLILPSSLCKGAEEGEGHYINNNANTTYNIFFWNFLRPLFFITMLTEDCVIRFRVFLLLFKLKKWRRPYLCQLFTHALPILTLVEPNQMMLGFLVDQSHSGWGKNM